MRQIRIGLLNLRTGNRSQLYELLRKPEGGASARSIGYLNPHVYNQVARDPLASKYLEECDFVCLDGIGAALAGRLLNGPWLKRLERLVMDQMFDAAVLEGRLRGRALLLGPEMADNTAAAEHLRMAAPGLEIVAGADGFREDSEYAALFRRHADVDFVLAGMGSPKSERILSEARRICGGAVCWHVGGGTLRNWAGSKRRAPRIVSRFGLEWAHRMAFEPEMLPRYVRGIPEFVFRAVRDMARPRRVSPQLRPDEGEAL